MHESSFLALIDNFCSYICYFQCQKLSFMLNFYANMDKKCYAIDEIITATEFACEKIHLHDDINLLMKTV